MNYLWNFFWVMYIACFTLTASEQAHFEEQKIVGYYAGWSMYRNPSFLPKDIDGTLITHLNYAFVKVEPQGNIRLFDSWADIEHRTDWNTPKPFWGNFAQLLDLKEKYPHLKTLFSVGGWTLSDNFSAIAASPQARQNFVQQSIKFADKYHFDGIDIDWEYPGFADHNGKAEDKQNFTLLLRELHLAAKAHTPELLVTIAAPAGPQHYANIELQEIYSYVDWINLMTYDFHGGWDPTTNHNAPLYAPAQGDPNFNIDSAVTYYLSQGVPKEKLVIGMSFYGRSFARVASTSDGLFSSHQGPGQGTTQEEGMRFFYDIKDNLLSAYQRYWDDQAKVPYLYHPQLKEFVSYDDEESMAIKSQYIKEHSLGGAMIWELGLDFRPDWTLLKTIHRILRK